MNAARVAVQAWALRLRGVLAGLAEARLRWCVICGRVGLGGWQPLCAAMPITWVCTDRARCRFRQVQASQRERAWRRLAAVRRPGLTRPPTGRPWRPAERAGPDYLVQGLQPRVRALGAVAEPELAARAEEPTAELVVLAQPESDAATPGGSGGWR
jgi:hypothetical protein